jgi:hypothetical protein
MKLAALLFLTLPFFVACEQEGRGERIGEEIDEAVEDARAGGETTGNRVDDAIDEVREGAREVGEEVEDAVEDAREDD